MAKRDASSPFSNSTFSSEVQLNIRGVHFTLNKELLAARSAKVAALIKQNPEDDLSYLFKDIHVDAETLELVARFCYGFELSLSTENVIPLTCLAYYLEMTESHSNNNLLRKAITFFEQRVLPSWNETIKAYRAMGGTMQQAVHLGLIDACVDSLIEKVLVDPHLVAEPIKNLVYDEGSEDEEETYRPNPRRRLFVLEWKSEDLTTLSLHLYELVIQAMNQRGVPPEYIASSLCQYAKKSAFPSLVEGENTSIYKRSSQRDVLEAVQRLLPHEKGLIPCSFLFEMLRCAIFLECSNDCRYGFESRIGKQLDQAMARQLLIPSQGYAKELQYDIDCVRRILKHFYSNYTSSDVNGLISVAELIEEFFMEVASDIDLKIDTFVALAEMSMAASLGTHRNSDGIYRAIDIYLAKHGYLTEMERQDICRMLDCRKMSPEACEHVAKNERLPLRFKVQMLFAEQLQIRDTVTKAVQAFADKLRSEEVEEEGNQLKVGFDEEEVRLEMEKMSIKVMELEKKCHTMKREIQNGCTNHKMQKGKASMWVEMKRKFGCINSIYDCNCQVKRKKVHPKF